MDLINALCATLEIPYNSRTRVKKFLKNISRNPSYDTKKKKLNNTWLQEGLEGASSAATTQQMLEIVTKVNYLVIALSLIHACLLI